MKKVQISKGLVKRFLYYTMCLLLVITMASTVVAGGQLTITAQEIPFNSVCNLKRPADLPTSITFPPRSEWNMKGCQSIAEAFKSLKAVKLHITNPTDETFAFNIEKDFVNITALVNRRAMKPVVLQLFSSGFLGYVTDIPDTLKLNIDKGSVADVLVFFERAGRGDVLSITGLRKLEIH
jgi:hypothetical protein